MRKLELRMEDLVVESFEMQGTSGSQGTVFGRAVFEAELDEAASGYQTCRVWHTCGGEKTCNLDDTCYTWDGSPFTCNWWDCDPTYDRTCTCPEAA